MERVRVPASILVVDDDADTREMVAMLLVAEGYAVRTAANGLAALRDLITQPLPCCIVLDLSMSPMGGETLRLAQLRDPDLAAIPVIVVSGFPDAAKVATQIQATAYLTKPVASERLLALIEQLCYERVGTGTSW